MKKTTDFSKVDRLINRMMVDGLTNLGKDVKNRAVILAPKDSGDLRRSGVVNVKRNDTVVISFGNSEVKYARRRHYENNLHPSTRYYLTNALKSITNPAKYFRKLF